MGGCLNNNWFSTMLRRGFTGAANEPKVIYYYAMSCHVMSCHVMSCHVMSCHAAR